MAFFFNLNPKNKIRGSSSEEQARQRHHILAFLDPVFRQFDICYR